MKSTQLDFGTLIKRATNMVEIESIILTEVGNKYMSLFADTERKFVRANESQEDWVKAVNDKYKHEANDERLVLFTMIPDRFHKTFMYKKLSHNLVERTKKLMALSLR